jgi:hypothetical protein
MSTIIARAATLPKIATLALICDEAGPPVRITTDGGYFIVRLGVVFAGASAYVRSRAFAHQML